MLDTLSQKILIELNRPENAADLVHDFSEDLSALAKTLRTDNETVRAAVRYLHELNYLKYQVSSSQHVTGFYLDHKGLHWREFRRHEIIKYLEEKWVDCAALLLSIAALICSLT